MPLRGRGPTIKQGTKDWDALASVGSGDDDSKEYGVFRAKLLGSVTVDEAKDDSVVVLATAKVKKQGEAARKVFMIVTSQELKILDQDNKDIIQSSDVLQIVYTGLNPEDKKVFCYTTKSKYGVLHCHIFVVKEKAQEIKRAIGDAMKYASSLIKQSNQASESSDGRSVSDLKAFDAFYLGYEAVAEPRGAMVVKKALEANDIDRKRLSQQAARSKRSTSKKDSSGDAVTLLLTPESIRTVERLSGETVMNDFIKHVTFSSTDTDQSGNEIFSYISCDERHNSMMCHIFSVPHGQAKIIRSALKEMVQLGKEKHGLQGSNPFAALPNAPREIPKGELYKKQIHRSDLKAVHVIGAGQYGEVYLALQTARLKGGGIIDLKRAIKMVRNNATQEDKVEFLREAETQLAFEQENLVKMVGVAVQQAPWLAVLEYCDHGDVRAVVRACKEKKIKLQYDEQINFCEQLAAGMAHLTAKRYVHMDLAARNCLLAQGNVVKVADFGLTRPLDANREHLILRERLKLPLKWVSIEGLDDKIFGQPSDCWSFGVLMWEILSYGETPYPYVKTPDIQDAIRNGLRLDMPEGTAPKFWAVISKCWNSNPKMRWTFTNLQIALRDLIPEAPESPRRDIGIYLKSGGTDMGDNSGHKSRMAHDEKEPVAPPAQKTPGSDRPVPAARPRPTQRQPTGGGKETSHLNEPTDILMELKLSQYVNNFRAKQVTKSDLATANDSYLISLGIQSATHRMVIFGYLRRKLAESPQQQQQQQQSTSPTSHARKRVEAPPPSTEAPVRRRDPTSTTPSPSSTIPTSSTSQTNEQSRVSQAFEERQRKLIERQRKAEQLKQERLKKEAEQEKQREEAIAKHAEEARRIAEAKVAERRVAQESAKQEERRMSMSPAKVVDPSERTAVMREQNALKEQRDKQAAQLETSSKTNKLLKLKGSKVDLFGAESAVVEEWGVGKSKIWKALNPQPIAFQTGRDRAEAEDNIVHIDVQVGHTDYSYLNEVQHTAELIEDDDMEGTFEGEEDDDEEEEEEEEDVDPDALAGLDADFMKTMQENRAKRDKEEQAHKAQLRAEYQASKEKEQAALDKELAIIRAQQAIERKEKEAAKDVAVQEALTRMETELTFDFAFG